MLDSWVEREVSNVGQISTWNKSKPIGMASLNTNLRSTQMRKSLDLSTSRSFSAELLDLKISCFTKPNTPWEHLGRNFPSTKVLCYLEATSAVSVVPSSSG